MPHTAPRRLSLALALLAAVSAGVRPLGAEPGLTAGHRERLLDVIAEAGASFDPARLPRLEPAKQDTAAAILRVRERFAAGTDPDNFRAWMAYLDLEPLSAAIERDAPPAELIRQSLTVRGRLVGTWPGLELSYLRDLRERLDGLVAAAQFGDADVAANLFERQLQILSDQVVRLEPIPTADRLAGLSRILEILQATGQSEPLVSTFSRTFSQPNIVAWVGDGVIREAVGRPIEQHEPVRECILGTRLQGQGQLRGSITADLVPSRGAARLAIRLTGSFESRNTGYSGPVRLRTVGRGDVSAIRTVAFSDQGVRLEPHTANASLQTQITSIEHHLRLVRKIASKRAARQKPAADRIALGRLRERIGRRFAEQTAAISRPPVLDEAIVWLQRLDIPEPAQQWNSSEKDISVALSVSRASQLNAPLPPPTPPPGCALCVQIHETAVDNALARFLGGRTVRQKQVHRLMELIDRPVPDPLSADDLDLADDSYSADGSDSAGESDSGQEADGNEPPFEIDFHRVRPVIFEARDGVVRIGLRGSRFEQGTRSLDRSLEITATYRPRADENGVVSLVRDDEVRVDFPRARPRPASLTETALRGNIKRLFEDVFPPTLLDRPVRVPDDSPLESMRGREFFPRQVLTQDGWLTLAIR